LLIGETVGGPIALEFAYRYAREMSRTPQHVVLETLASLAWRELARPSRA
jgi:hypothetical protein